MQFGTSTINVLTPPVPSGAVWLDIHVPDSDLGAIEMQLSAPAVVVMPDLLAAVDDRTRFIASEAMKAVAGAMQAHPELCSRCARTLMRASMGSDADRAALRSPAKAGDAQRYAAAWKVLEPSAKTVRQAMELLAAQLRVGNVAAIVEQVAAPVLPTAQAAGDHRRYYELAGAPMKAGQWGDYKACACGAPSSGEQPVQMAGCVPDGSCGCGCGGKR